MLRKLLMTSLVAFAGSCAAFINALNAPPQRTVTVTLVGAVISPGKADGHQWDMDLGVPPELQSAIVDFAEKAVSKALSTAVAGETGMPTRLTDMVGDAVVGVISNAIERAAAPDPYGVAIITNNLGLRAPRMLLKENDTYFPQWNMTWNGIPWSDSPSLFVRLVDSDDFRDDPIADVVIQSSDFDAALAEGSVHFVDVRSQGAGQLLVVAMVVRPEGWTP